MFDPFRVHHPIVNNAKILSKGRRVVKRYLQEYVDMIFLCVYNTIFNLFNP